MHKGIDQARNELLVTIVDRGRGNRITEICEENHVNFHFICLGLGTANSEMLDYLGIGETEKDVVLSLAPSGKIPTLFAAFCDKMNMKRPGRGIAFTLPISGMSSLISRMVTHDEQTPHESEVCEMDSNANYALLITIVNQGYVDEVMAAAKSAGATGGTLLDARGVGYEEAERFIGVSLQSEKSMLLIICKNEARQAIMQAISKVAGAKTEARGVILSLPVDDMVGIAGMDQ